MCRASSTSTKCRSSSRNVAAGVGAAACRRAARRDATWARASPRLARPGCAADGRGVAGGRRPGPRRASARSSLDHRLDAARAGLVGLRRLAESAAGRGPGRARARPGIARSRSFAIILRSTRQIPSESPGTNLRGSGSGCVRCIDMTSAPDDPSYGARPGDELEERRAERVDVGPRVDVLHAADLLGRDVLRRPDGLARLRQRPWSSSMRLAMPRSTSFSRSLWR